MVNLYIFCNLSTLGTNCLYKDGKQARSITVRDAVHHMLLLTK